MEEDEFYSQLVQRYADNLLSAEEYEVFFHALRAGLLSPQLVAAMTGAGAIPASDPQTEALARETAEIQIHAATLPQTPVRRLPRWARIAAAVVVIAFLAGGAWLWISRSAHRTTETGELAQKPIPPGGNKATLTLSNGQTILLDGAARGSLALQGNARVTKTDSNRLAYTASSNEVVAVNNTLTTPRGGQYQLTLPDGTRVWLNAASAITYPTAFIGKQRAVTVSGEAYFDVVKDAARTFCVNIRATTTAREDAQIEVLGTGFNVTAYPDEPAIRTTLIQGAIRVHRSTASVVLHPGQQALITPAAKAINPIQLNDNADTAAAIAWITGFFQFRELDVPAVMRQIARWYNVDVVYNVPAASLAGRHFGGRISRRQNLSDLLPILEANGIHFRLDGTTIHVLP
jgi:ferric-dicitrate binding protein FerR (iron transport regulator)